MRKLLAIVAPPQCEPTIEEMKANLTSLREQTAQAEKDLHARLYRELLALSNRAGGTLTRRELDVFRLVSQPGMSNKEIAAKLNIAERTVKFHVSSILAALHLANRHEIWQMYSSGSLGLTFVPARKATE